MQTTQFKFVTDTSTLCVFDPGALRHRLDAEADWWCWPLAEQVQELNFGNVAFVDLGRDGEHFGSLSNDSSGGYEFQVLLSCPSGRLFVGAGEEATSEGMEPEGLRGGLFHSVPAGTVVLQASRSAEGHIHLAITPSTGLAANAFTQPLCFGTPAV